MRYSVFYLDITLKSVIEKVVQMVVMVRVEFDNGV